MRTRPATWLAATALVMVLVVDVPAHGAQSWQPCPENPGTSCAAVTVPVDWSRPGGDRLDIAVARREAGGTRTGTLVYLPAGPGSSGVDAVTNDQIFDLLFPPRVAEHFDIVSFDPRGVRRSHPVECDADLVARLNRPTPADQRQFDELLATQAEVGADCRRRTGPVFDHLDSVAVAHDVDALRVMLGEPELNVYALSYGTVVGQMYAETFPRRIRTMVLDAVFDHGVDSDRFALTGAFAAQEAFEQFVSWCAAEPACELHGTDVRARLAALFDAPGTDPAEILNRVVPPFTRADLPAVARELARPAVAATSSRTPLPIYLQCADNRNDTTTFAHAERLRAQSRAVAPDVRGTAFVIADLCVNPPVPATNPQRPLHVSGVPPIMVLTSRYDVSTPYQGARHVAAQLPRATLVTYDGMGHGAATRTPCTGDLVYRYFSERRLPPPDTHCPAVPVRQR